MFYENRTSVVSTLAHLQKIDVAKYPSLIGKFSTFPYLANLQ